MCSKFHTTAGSFQVNLDLAFVDGTALQLSDLDAVVRGPDGRIVDPKLVQLRKSRTNTGGAILSLMPTNVGLYQVYIIVEEMGRW